MARKAVNGYPEKSFYDNTFFAGVVATGDPLNEGSFALITNFNITDSGKSIVPRDGFLSTTFQVDGEDIVLSDKVIMFRDPNIQKDVVIDFAKVLPLEEGEEQLEPFAYLVDITPYAVDADKNKIFKGTPITDYDVKDLVNFVRSFGNNTVNGYLSEITFNDIANRLSVVEPIRLQPIRDKDGVIFYITKLKLGYPLLIPPGTPNNPTNRRGVLDFWVKVLYRDKGNTERDPTLTDNTLVVSVVDTTQQTTKLAPRNIASEKSVVRYPLRTQEEAGVLNTSVSDIGATMLIHTPKGYATKNLDDSFKTSLDISLEPMFHLQDPERVLGVEGAKWAYRFSIINTSDINYKDPGESIYAGTTSYPTYKTPWRTLSVENMLSGENEPIKELNLVGTDVTEFTEEYTFFVFPDETNTKYASVTKQLGWEGAVSERLDLSSIETFEKLLYIEMQRSGNDKENATSLDNLEQAYLVTKDFESTIPANRSIELMESYLFDSLKYKFVSEVSLIKALNENITPAAGNNDTTKKQYIKNCVSRETHFNHEDFFRVIAEGTLHTYVFKNGYEADEETVSAPHIIVDADKYDKIDKLTFRQFVTEATKIGKTKKIKIVILPFLMHIEQSYEDPDRAIHNNAFGFCSVQGIYVSGMRDRAVAAPDVPTGPVATWEYIKNIRAQRILTVDGGRNYKYIDAFSDLSKLRISDLLEHIPREVFQRGVVVTMYLTPYTENMLKKTKDMNKLEINALNTAWDAATFKQTAQGFWSQPADVVYIHEHDEDNPPAINESTQYVVFEDRLVVWSGNRVYISEEGDYFFFTEIMKKVFPEEVLKVIAFKGILLVFTSQNLYAIYRVENEVEVESNEKDEEGKTKMVTTTEIIWLQQPVLYNINPDRRYLDVIQVYNQMVLFYSSEGQLYMIKPSNTIDRETQFGIQYFNKSANHIFAHYEEYINERLKMYGKLIVDDPNDYVTKDQVKIKALLDIDTIKIFFSVPNRITFVIVYDVVNNRYTTYDTLSFTQIENAWHVEGGEAYLTKEGTHTYFTLPIQSKLGMDQNADMHYQNSFRKEPIFTFLDTGVLNLNNHITKRMRDLRVTIKNIDATKILYNAELVMDDSIIRPFYAPDFRVKMMNGPDYVLHTTETPQEDLDELFGLDQTIGVEGTRSDLSSTYLYQDKEFFDKNTILKTETLNSTRLIEYNSSILSVGKNIRLRLQFVSKGKYKLQSFSIIYKEKHA